MINLDKKEIFFLIAAGRAYLDLERKLKEFPINFDCLIFEHKTAILDRNRNIIKQYVIDNHIIKNILNKLDVTQGIKRTILFNIYDKNVTIEINNLTKLMINVDNSIIGNELSDFININFKEVKSYVILTNKYILVEII